ncbi:hypothetical protein OC846_006717, partial [Tilletia horrida]
PSSTTYEAPLDDPASSSESDRNNTQAGSTVPQADATAAADHEAEADLIAAAAQVPDSDHHDPLFLRNPELDASNTSKGKALATNTETRFPSATGKRPATPPANSNRFEGQKRRNKWTEL